MAEGSPTSQSDMGYDSVSWLPWTCGAHDTEIKRWPACRSLQTKVRKLTLASLHVAYAEVSMSKPKTLAVIPTFNAPGAQGAYRSDFSRSATGSVDLLVGISKLSRR